jgi:hypothetical protein
MKIILIIVLSLGLSSAARAQQSTLDIPAMHQLINESKDEYALQSTAKNKQAAATTNEKANTDLLSKLKSSYRKLQQRYNTLGTAIDVAEIGVYGTPMVEQIIAYQSQIVELTEADPALAALGLATEIEFAQKAQSLLGYVVGLSLSIGDVNQMKASDRKLLFDYVLSELATIQQLSGNLARLLTNSGLLALIKSATPFGEFISRDKSLVDQIIINTKYLK